MKDSKEPINICPICKAPFTKGTAGIKNSDDVQKHYWYHMLDNAKPVTYVIKGEL